MHTYIHTYIHTTDIIIHIHIFSFYQSFILCPQDPNDILIALRTAIDDQDEEDEEEEDDTTITT